MLRVYELAKIYRIENKKFLELLDKSKIEVHSHLATLTDDQVEKIEKN